MHGLSWVAACGARGHVRWAYPERSYVNFDAVFFVCVLGFPLLPLRAAHVFRYRPSGPFARTYEWIPIRWTPGLLFLAWVRRATLVLAVWAVPLALAGAAAVYGRNDPDGWRLLGLCLAAWVAFPVVWAGCWLLDRRNRTLRRVMGSWRWGPSDPMTYQASWVAASDFATARPNYGADTYAEAVENCLRIHNWWGGLFAARMVQRFEDADLGRAYVERIMTDPEVVAGLAAVRRDPGRWYDLLGPGRYQR